MMESWEKGKIKKRKEKNTKEKKKMISFREARGFGGRRNPLSGGEYFLLLLFVFPECE